MINTFLERLKGNGQTRVWFNKKYCPDTLYPYLIMQLNGTKNITKEVEKAIKNYMEEK